MTPYETVGPEQAVWRDEDGSKGDRFTYSANNQLTGAWYKGEWAWAGEPGDPERTVDYSYPLDMLNRQSVTDNGATTNYTMPNGMNQYTGVGSRGIGYDDRFNVTSYNGANFTYDAQNQLVGGSIQAIYDGLGRCVKRTINGVTRFITYDDWNPIYEWDASGNAVDANFYGTKADEIIGRWDSSWGFQFYKQDKQGSVMEVLDQNGGIVEKYRYDAFGQPTISDWNGVGRTSSAIGNRFMYTGREWIGELGIYDYRHRMYHPGLGRFLQSDPMGLQTEGAKLTPEQKALYGAGAPEAFASSEMNLFCYCGDDPVDKSDPFGLRDVDVYIWDIDVSHQSVGHVMVTEHDSHTVLLSQFPQRSGPKGPNVRLSFDETVRREHRPADHVMTTHVRDDKAFDRTVRDHATRPYWYWNPSKPNETHCARSTYDALRDGGAGVWGHDRGQVLPRDIRQQLEQIQRDNFEAAHPKPVRQ